jgi:aspartate racemase
MHAAAGAERPIWGVVGGMGPLASAEFLKTIYECRIQAGVKEQESPIVVLYSDPTFPDRTESFLKNEYEVLLQRLESVLATLDVCTTGIIICCMTIHAILDRVREPLRSKVVSLLDVVFEQILGSNREYLLICTEGSRKMRLFENHPLWSLARKQIILPGEQDQKQLHQMIFEVKSNLPGERHLEFVGQLLGKYGTASFIAGCTEIHILVKHMARQEGRPDALFCIDPLMSIARALALNSDFRPSIAAAAL